MADIVHVPNAPGVPAVLFAAADQFLPSLLTADTYSYFGSVFGPQWGVFLNGTPIVVADTVLSFDYRQDWVISDYPLEEGSFESYDKVRTPFDGRFRFASGGSEDNRRSLLASIAAIADDLNLYDVVTPEQVYTNVSIRHYSYQRTAVNGLGLMVVDVACQEIRVSTSSGGLVPQSASAAPVVNGGTVQPLSPTNTQNNALPLLN